MREKEIRRGLVVSQFSCTALNLQEHWSEIGPLPDPDSVGLAKSVLINRGSDFCENWNGKPIHIIKLLLIALLSGGWAHPKNRYLFLWINDVTDVKQKQNKKNFLPLGFHARDPQKNIKKYQKSEFQTATLYSKSEVIYFCTPVITGIHRSKQRETLVFGPDRKQIYNVISPFSYFHHNYVIMIGFLPRFSAEAVIWGALWWQCWRLEERQSAGLTLA